MSDHREARWDGLLIVRDVVADLHRKCERTPT